MKDLIIIKIGGQAISELTDDFFEQLAVWRTQGKKILLLHGGGPLITKLCQQLQVPVVKKAGVRVTDAQTLALTKLVLLGQAQPLLLQKLSDHQLPVVGLNAADNQMLVGKYWIKASTAKWAPSSALIKISFCRCWTAISAFWHH